MKRSWKWTLPAALAVVLVVGPLDAQQKNVLVSKKVATPPAIDTTIEDLWKEAPPLTVKVVGGRNLPGGSTEVTLRSVYSGDTVYFLMQYKDPT
ncbi:MAG TPA: hypothetical protein VGT40_18180, partial [Methylomirabilota bacterium]|nr:hypothetical protein [Methylomirabilota bacterium]